MVKPPGPITLQQNSEKHVCRYCGKEAMLVWEDVDRARHLVRIDGDFYERISKKPPFPIEIVCNACGKAQISPLQS